LSVDAKAAIGVTPARWLTETRSFEDANRIVRETVGLSELTYESQKAQGLRARTARVPTWSDLPTIDALVQQVRQRGADYVSMRRLAELFGATNLDAFAALSALLVTARPDRYESSLYRA
jgi:thioredoxin-like negative regulator of GroEL